MIGTQLFTPFHHDVIPSISEVNERTTVPRQKSPKYKSQKASVRPKIDPKYTKQSKPKVSAHPLASFLPFSRLQSIIYQIRRFEPPRRSKKLALMATSCPVISHRSDQLKFFGQEESRLRPSAPNSKTKKVLWIGVFLRGIGIGTFLVLVFGALG